MKASPSSKKNKLPWPGITRSTSFTDEEKTVISSICDRYGIRGVLNESVLSKMRAALNNIRDSDDDSMDEEFIDKLYEIMMSSSKFAKFLSEHFDKSFDKILEYYVNNLRSSKKTVMNAVAKGSFDYPRKNIEKEINDLSRLCEFWLIDFKRILAESNTEKFAKCLIAESACNNADVVKLFPKFSSTSIMENKNQWTFLDKAKQAIADVQPYKTINEISSLCNNISNKSFNEFARLSNKIGCPECVKFSGIGSMCGKLSETCATKVDIGTIIKADPVLRFMPCGESLIMAFELIAYAVTALEIINELKKNK